MSRELTDFQYMLVLKEIDKVCMELKITMREFFEEAQKAVDEMWEMESPEMRKFRFPLGKPSVEELIYTIAVETIEGAEKDPSLS